jgi:hypothetical protein
MQGHFTKWDALGVKLIMQERTMYLSYNIFSKPFTIQSIIQPSKLHNEYLPKWKGFLQVRPFSYGEQLKQVNWTHLKLILIAKGSKDSMHHTYVEVEEGVSLVDPNLPLPPIFLFPLKVGDVFLHMWSPSPSFLKRWMFCYIFWGGGIFCLTPLPQRKRASEGIPKTRGFGHTVIVVENTNKLP